ncbi:nascent polypeptide-associated complex protein [Candidatus Micrarchaeota archaeon]|nr:nascent polypeptide-associated complex protein [Candidatus Micrarchaeota archaeon]
MFGGIDPKQMSAMMKKMGIKTDDIEASEVVIKGKKTIVIRNPHVTMMEVQGQKTFQVMGDVSETSAPAFTEEDAELVAEKTGHSKEEAKKALSETNGDIAEAIVLLS